MKAENIAIGTICSALLLTTVLGGVADLRLAGKAERQMTASAVLTQAPCDVPSAAMTYSDPSCAGKPHRTELYYRARMEDYRARMEALAQN